MLSHARFLPSVEKFLAAGALAGGREQFFAYLPMAWIGDTIFSLAFSLRGRFVVNMPRGSRDGHPRPARDRARRSSSAPPRIWENLLTRHRGPHAGRHLAQAAHLSAASSTGPPGTRPTGCRGNGPADPSEPGSPTAPAKSSSTDRCGTRSASAASATPTPAAPPSGDEAIQRLRGIGVNLKQVYGSTEMGLVTLTPDDEVVPDSVGRPLPGVDITISDDGEVLVRSDSLFHGYYRNPEATAAAMTADGCFRSGDSGFFDTDGHLVRARPGQGRRQAGRRHDVRPAVHREQAQVQPLHQGGGGRRRRAAVRRRPHQHRRRQRRDVGRASTASSTPASPTCPASRLSTTSSPPRSTGERRAPRGAAHPPLPRASTRSSTPTTARSRGPGSSAAG